MMRPSCWYAFIYLLVFASLFCPKIATAQYGNDVFDISPDGDYLWLGTSGGLIKFHTQTAERTTYLPPGYDSHLMNKYVASTISRREGGRYIATTYNGMWTFIDEQWERIEGVEENGFREVAYGPQGNLWILGAALLYELDSDTLIVHDNIRGDISGGSSESNTALTFQSDGSVWVAGGWGLSRISNGALLFHMLYTTQYLERFYTKLTTDSDGWIWIARSDGLWKTNGATIKTFDPADTNQPTGDIFSLNCDSDGMIWAGGIHWFGSFDGHTWAVYDSTDYGLLGETGVYDLYFDEDDILWLGTRDGLIKFDGTTWTHYDLETGTIDTAVETSTTPSAIELHHASPNPFNPSTTIAFTLPEADTIRLSVFTVNGQEVAILEDNFLAPGTHAVVFDGSGLSSGVYFYRLESSETAASGKMLLLK